MPEGVETFNENWDRILNDIGNGRLIPVVGSELLVIDVDGEKCTLDSLVAEELIVDLNLDRNEFGDAPSLSEITYLYQHQGKDPDNVYAKYQTILNTRNWSIPEPLRKLAEVSGFRLFLTTTPDDMMIRALNDVRHAGEAKTQRCSYFSTGAPLVDLPRGYRAGSGAQTTVFKLFGEMADCPDFALTEEDVLMCVSRLSHPDEGPESLINLLKRTAIVQLGCSFENWLNRFFYCSTRNDALFAGKAGGVIADSHTRTDEDLQLFLQRNKTQVYPGNAVDFVDELHRRWSIREGDATAEEPQSESSQGEITRPSNTVFISYAREDQEDALRMKAVLDRHVDVWMDPQLEGGQIFEDEIMKAINECIVFIPLISGISISGGGRFFRKEWHAAVRKMVEWPRTHPFIQPVFIDETLVGHPDLPEEFSRAQMTSLSELDDDFGKRVRRAVERQLKKEIVY